MNTKPGPSKRSSSSNISCSRAAKRGARAENRDSDDFDEKCSSEEAVYFQCRAIKQEEEEHSEDSDSINSFDSHLPKCKSVTRIQSSSRREHSASLHKPIQDNAERPSRQEATSAWSSERKIKSIEFTKAQALLIPAPSDPLEAFRLFLDVSFLDMIVRETNINAGRVLHKSDIKKQARIKRWQNLTREELLTFLGLLLHTGTIRLNRLTDYWKQHWLFNIPCFRQYMSRDRFLLILRCLHFTSESNDADRLAKIRPIVNNFNETMKNIYYPGKQVSVNESMVLRRGRLIFRQYIKNKPHNGIKLYVLAQPEGIVLKLQLCTGAGEETSEMEHTQKIVLNLLEEKLDVGHSVYMGNYNNSYDLAEKLLDRKTYFTGILSKNRKENLVNLGTATLPKGENKSLFLNGVNIGEWKDKQHVLYLSTEHGDEMLEVINKRGHVALKPSPIVHYNNFMSGINLQDQMLSYYPCERKMMLWYKKVFVHILQISLSNAWFLFNNFSTENKINLYNFRLAIIEKLLPKPIIQKKILVTEHKLTKIENFKIREKREGSRTRTVKEVVRKECRGCKEKKKRVTTVYECKGCPGSPGYCMQCFCKAHS